MAKDNRIFFSDAADLVLNFCMDNDLGFRASKQALSGIIKLDNIRLAPVTGLVAWNCYNPGVYQKFPELFVAFEDFPATQVEPNRTKPMQAKLWCTKDPWVYNGAKTKQAIEALLRKQAQFPVQPNNEITNGQVEILGRIFTQAIINEDNERCNEFPFMTFDNNLDRDFEDFLDQCPVDPVYIRYYFGYSDGEQSNKIRVILVPVNAQGVNIELNKNGSDIFLLERTFP